MRIQIAKRMRVFSHQPGLRCPIPCTRFALQVFPTRLKLIDLTQRDLPCIQELALPYQGPVQDFTAELDLEQGSLRVWGQAVEGYFRYRVDADGLTVEKGPELPQLAIERACGAPRNLDRLWLGSDKQLQWERLSLRERLPLLLLLAQWMPETSTAPLSGDLETLFALLCRDMLCPCPVDELHLGITVPELEQLNPLEALQALAGHCRSLFIDQDSILPQLPAAFHCGRYLSQRLDFEWSKKQIRRVRYQADENGALGLGFRHVTSCRLRQTRLERGCRKDLAQPIVLEAGQTYLLDRFER